MPLESTFGSHYRVIKEYFDKKSLHQYINNYKKQHNLLQQLTKRLHIANYYLQKKNDGTSFHILLAHLSTEAKPHPIND